MEKTAHIRKTTDGGKTMDGKCETGQTRGAEVVPSGALREKKTSCLVRQDELPSGALREEKTSCLVRRDELPFGALREEKTSCLVRQDELPSEVLDYLLSYGFCRRWLEAAENEKTLFGADDPGLCRARLEAKMFDVRRFVMSLPDRDEKLFLYYHYIRCESMERCAEIMSFSTRNVYRIKKSALRLAASRYDPRAPVPIIES